MEFLGVNTDGRYQVIEEEPILRVFLVREILPHDDVAGEDPLEDGAGEGADAARRKDGVRSAPGGRHRAGEVVLDEDDRRPVERDQPAHLADERAERVLDLERRPECARAPVRVKRRATILIESSCK